MPPDLFTPDCSLRAAGRLVVHDARYDARMSDGNVTVERRAHVAVITIDRPARKNALNQVMWAALGRAADELHARLPRAVVLTGAGAVFCAGMDVNPDNPQVAKLVGAVAQGEVGPARAMLDELHAVLDRLFALPVPIVAALGGLAYGGGAEIAARCDLRVADPAAVICFSEVKLGLMPDLGGGVALARLLGPGRAADLILTARKVGADEALALGLVNRISAPGGAVAAGVELAEAIAANGPRAVRAALAVIRGAVDRPLHEAIAGEVEAAARLIASGECQAGITALFAKAPPQFADPEEVGVRAEAARTSFCSAPRPTWSRGAAISLAVGRHAGPRGSPRAAASSPPRGRGLRVHIAHVGAFLVE